jgi:hypothetical protein
MSEPTPEHIASIDWRIHKLDWIHADAVSLDLSKSPLVGTPIVKGAFVDYGKQRIRITIPNATALLLGLSEQYHVEAQHWVEKSIVAKDDVGHLPEEEIFVFFERIMASVVFACTSLEAFVNEEIPDKYVHVIEERKFARHYDKEQIERQLNLDDKLGHVLPFALGVPSLKGGSQWQAYLTLRDLRDRIIHMKTKDRDFQGMDKGSIWNALLRDPLPETYKTAKAVMKHFYEPKAPRRDGLKSVRFEYGEFWNRFGRKLGKFEVQWAGKLFSEAQISL